MLGEIMRKREERRVDFYKLADESGLSRPDSNDSAGAEWLKEVWERAVHLRDLKKDENVYDIEDLIHEEADASVPIYTHNLWEVWVDLQGYNHPETYENYMIDQMGEMLIRDLNKIPQASLYDAARNILEKYV